MSIMNHGGKSDKTCRHEVSVGGYHRGCIECVLRVPRAAKREFKHVALDSTFSQYQQVDEIVKYYRKSRPISSE